MNGIARLSHKHVSSSTKTCWRKCCYQDLSFLFIIHRGLISWQLCAYNAKVQEKLCSSSIPENMDFLKWCVSIFGSPLWIVHLMMPINNSNCLSFLGFTNDFVRKEACKYWFINYHFMFTSVCFIWPFSTFLTDMSGNPVWSQTSGFQKLAKIDHYYLAY